MRRFIAQIILDLVVEDHRANEEDVKQALKAQTTLPATMHLDTGGQMTLRDLAIGGVREGLLPEQNEGLN